MARSNKICFLCGRKYHYCPTCSPDINKPSWYAMWCSEECKNLDQILAAHTMKHITTEEAQVKIKELKLKNVEFTDENVEKHYYEVMSYKIKNEESQKDIKENKATTSTSKILPKSKIESTNVQNNKKK